MWLLSAQMHERWALHGSLKKCLSWDSKTWDSSTKSGRARKSFSVRDFPSHAGEKAWQNFFDATLWTKLLCSCLCDPSTRTPHKLQPFVSNMESWFAMTLIFSGFGRLADSTKQSTTNRSRRPAQEREMDCQ